LEILGRFVFFIFLEQKKNVSESFENVGNKPKKIETIDFEREKIFHLDFH